MHLRLIRHATVLVELAGQRLLVDPMLDPAGARPPVEGAGDDRREPLCELPEPATVAVAGVGAVALTCLDGDHLDDTAVRLLPRDVPVLCQPPDAAALRERGFTDVRPVHDRLVWRGVEVTRIPASRRLDAPGEATGPASGYVLAAPGEPTVYVAGDTVFGDQVRDALERHAPEAVVVTAGAARSARGEPITMTADDVVAVARHAPGATIVAVHLDAVGHCRETRADLHQRLHDEGLAGRVVVPEDGAEVPLPEP